MGRPLKRALLVLGGATLFLALVAMALPLMVDVDRFKPRLEAATSDAMGMDVRIGGRIGLSLLPGPRITLEDARILDDQGVAVAGSKRLSVWLAPLSLLRGRLRLSKVELTQPSLSIVRTSEGQFNVSRLHKAMALLGAMDGARLSCSDGRVHYSDRGSGASFEATGVDLDVSRLRFETQRDSTRWQTIDLQLSLACARVMARDYSVDELKLVVAGKDGTFAIEPITMGLFGGQMAASMSADLSGPVPTCRLECSLPGFRIEEFLRTLSPEEAAEGAMDFTSCLSMTGSTASELMRSAAGEVSLRGRGVTLVGNDLDRALARFGSSQRFNLVDVGAVFLAGPLGVAVTKGYNFASLFRGSGGTSEIATLVSDWTVERGVATAQDVALATRRNRIALTGGLDFVREQFVDVTVAVVDPNGCATSRQTIRGSFAKPEVGKPGIIRSLAGPVLTLVRQTQRLLPTEPCEAFYSGSVPAPS